MIITSLVTITVFVILQYILFFKLHQRLQDYGERMKNIYANVDVLHKNQEELLAQNLRVMNENKKQLQTQTKFNNEIRRKK
jgi:hypothetical protein